MKPWATEEVAVSHNYITVTETSHLDRFVSYCNVVDHIAPIRILDLGCGNARLVLSLNKYLISSYYYVGTDISEPALKAGREQLIAKQNSTFELFLFDVDETPWDKSKFLDKKYDICLIDSTLHMFYEPVKVLEECVKYCNIIYITRNKLEVPSGIQRTLFKWGGMTEDSPYWKFSKVFFDHFAINYGKEIKYEAGPTPETFNIIVT
jgi:SAM-dependent methyltransferase